MAQRIDKDHARFKQIVRGRIKKELKRYMSNGELIGRKGKRFVSIPIPQIEIPRFKYGSNKAKGVGQGEGEAGTAVDTGEEGYGFAGDKPGKHILEVDVPLEELAKLMGEELELPNIQPKGKKSLITEKERYTGIYRAGPESLRHFKRTYKEALKRMLRTGLYDPDNPVIIPIRDDKRYRSWKVSYVPETKAVIIYMMDVSGSMGSEQKEMVRIESFWIDMWLRSQYKDLEVRYIVHDAAAREVDQYTFFHLRESGGTKISSAYSLCNKIIDEHFDPTTYNIYPFHFSDGDNWGGDDTRRCNDLLKDELLPKCNVFCYGQVKSAYGSGQFIKELRSSFEGEDKLILSEIKDRDSIYDSIKTFLGKGR
jgi:sporulation protein YhbH